jgi:hypothetical protein
VPCALQPRRNAQPSKRTIRRLSNPTQHLRRYRVGGDGGNERCGREWQASSRPNTALERTNNSLEVQNDGEGSQGDDGQEAVAQDGEGAGNIKGVTRRHEVGDSIDAHRPDRAEAIYVPEVHFA